MNRTLSRRLGIALGSVLLPLSLVGCKSEPASPGAAQSSSPPAAATSPQNAPAPAAPAGPPPPSFKRVIQPWFQVHCAEAKSCHGNSPAWSVDLDLRADAAYKALVNESAERRLDTKRVKPGDPASSFLVDKLRGTLRPREGKAMPLDPRTGKAVTPIPEDPDFIDHALIPWIQAGAPNN